MKICPICEKIFSDELNFCLEDGSILVEEEKHDPEQTLSFSQEPSRQSPYQNQTEAGGEVTTKQQIANRQTVPFRNSPPNLLMIIGVFFGIGLLAALGVVGGYLYWRSKPPIIIDDPPISPTYTPRYPTPTSPTPKTEDNIKVEILDKMANGFGDKYLKCKVTNTSENVVDVGWLGLSFYEGEVKIKDSSASLKPKILKPNQTVPVWINLYGVDKYTSVKVKEPTTARPVTKSTEELYPPLEFSETEMKGELGYMMVNFRQYRKIFYKVRGIVQNPKEEKITAEIFVLFYDANSEIVGIESTRVSNLEKGEKTKFEVQEVETDMFGKPETFEIIAISDR